MENQPILITGCQRTGTTLLNLILDSHPEICGIDEMEFDASKVDDYLRKSDYHPNVSFKLPTYAPYLSFVKTLPNVRVLWCMRDPRDVVASMVALHLPFDRNTTVPWAAHPLGSHREIVECYPVLSTTVKRKLRKHMKKYGQISTTHPLDRTQKDIVFTAGLCWRIKNHLPPLYKKNRISYKIVFYEKLITSPKEEISQILKYLEMS